MQQRTWEGVHDGCGRNRVAGVRAGRPAREAASLRGFCPNQRNDPVIPAEAGIPEPGEGAYPRRWIPACAGMTMRAGAGCGDTDGGAPAILSFSPARHREAELATEYRPHPA